MTTSDSQDSTSIIFDAKSGISEEEQREILVFDAKSGISEEEQREILAKINNIAEKNRLSLAEGDGKSRKKRFKAKKSGGRFPVVVNIIAFAFLAAGIFILISMQGKTDAKIKTGKKVYNSAERALIEEIRRETQNEAMGLASVELERLNREQYQAAAIEDQMGAFFSNLNRQIGDNRLDEAGATIRAMREFINTPAFEVLRSIQARKGLYTQAINSFETMIEEAKRLKDMSNGDDNSYRESAAQASGLQARISQLEQNLAEKDKTIDALSSQGSGASRRLSELEKTNNTLQTENTRLNRTNTGLQTQNTQLKSDLDKQTQAAASSARDLQAEKAETARLNQSNTRNEAALANRNDVINKIRGVIEGGKSIDDMSYNDFKDSLEKIQSALRSLN